MRLNTLIIMARMFLTETLPTVPALQFKPVNPNDIARYIVNTLIGLTMLVGFVIGGVQLAHGLQNTSGNPGDKWQGVYTMIGSIVVAGLVFAVVNMFLV